MALATVTVTVTSGGMALTPSGPVTVTANGQIVQGRDITATGNTAGIRINGFSDVVVRNCRIRHATGRGIHATSSPRLLIEDVDILCTGAPAVGPNPSSNMNNIETVNCPDAVVRRIRARNGSTGVYVIQGHRTKVSFIEGYNFRGPFPRGQVVQFDGSLHPVFEDFSVENEGHVAWTEDNVNCYGCTDPIVRRGFIRGNNSRSGIGVLFENNTGGSGGLCEDVDVVYWGNGAFSAADATNGVHFWRCRARDGVGPAGTTNTSVGKLDYQGVPIPTLQTWYGSLNRGNPLSGQEAFHAYQTGAANIEYHQAQYFNLPRSPNRAWDQNRMSVREFALVDFVPRPPIRLTFPWE
jgi:hypothetical protein